MKANVSGYPLTQSSRFTVGRALALLPKQRLIYVRDLLITLVGRDIKLHYKRSVLGIAWSLVTPLAQFAVLYMTFDVLLPLNVPNYFTFLFCGLLVWNWFQGSFYQATSAVVDNRELIKRPGFPMAILPIVTITSHLIHFLLALPILFVFLLLSGTGITSAVLALPMIIMIQFILTLGFAYFTAAFYVTFRDTQHLLGVLLNMLFFMTPVFYKASDLPARYQFLYRLNPVTHLIESYRLVLLSGRLPDLTALLVLGFVTVGILFFGYYVFRRASGRFVDEL